MSTSEIIWTKTLKCPLRRIRVQRLIQIFGLFYYMENLEWYPFYYKGLETNIQATRCGKVRRVYKHWLSKSKFSVWQQKIGIVEYEKFKTKTGYYIVGVKLENNVSKPIYLHHIIASIFLNYDFTGFKLVVDHLDNNKLNNKSENLKIVTNRENTSKIRFKKSGLPLGITFNKRINRYRASTYINGKTITIGHYQNIDDAKFAYSAYMKMHSIFV